MSDGFCEACGADVRAAARFCGACGAPIAASGERVGSPFGDYTIESIIAEGGMGVVYAARDARLNRRVALKLLRDEFAADDDFRARFIGESQAAAAIDHPNILPIYEAGEHDGTLFIASQLVDGSDLKVLLEREGVLSSERALAILGQVAAALDAAHAAGLVHRDVKPANALVVPEVSHGDHAYLVDFGIAKRYSGGTDGRTRIDGFIGTPEYAAPEQINGAAVDARTDVYALSLVLYECVVGGTPFPRDTSVAILSAHLNDEPPVPSSKRTGISHELDAAILRGLQKNPRHRHQTCRALISAARTAPGTTSASEVTSVRRAPRPRPPAAPPPPPAPASRNRGPLIALLSLLALLAIGGGAALAIVLGEDKSTSSASTIADTRSDTTAQEQAKSQARQRKARERRREQRSAQADRENAALESANLQSFRSLDGYDVSLPTGWRVLEDDQEQNKSGPSRRTTEVEEANSGVRLVIDHLPDYDKTAEENRAAVAASHEKNAPSYRFVGFNDVTLAQTIGYEWRYTEIDRGQRRRYADLMIDRDAHLFAVLSSARYADYDLLARLSSQVADTISVTDFDAQ